MRNLKALHIGPYAEPTEYLDGSHAHTAGTHSGLLRNLPSTWTVCMSTPQEPTVGSCGTYRIPGRSACPHRRNPQWVPAEPTEYFDGLHALRYFSCQEPTVGSCGTYRLNNSYYSSATFWASPCAPFIILNKAQGDPHNGSPRQGTPRGLEFYSLPINLSLLAPI